MSDPEYDRICNLIYDSYFNACVLWIERIDNDYLLAKYESRKIDFEENNINYDELELFHGTKEENIGVIAREGFNSDYNTRSAFGKGTYLASTAGYSFNYMTSATNIITYMFICNAIIGNKKMGDAKAPFECNVNKMTYSSIFAIPDNDSIYPKYIVAFHKNAK